MLTPTFGDFVRAVVICLPTFSIMLISESTGIPPSLTTLALWLVWNFVIISFFIWRKDMFGALAGILFAFFSLLIFLDRG